MSGSDNKASSGSDRATPEQKKLVSEANKVRKGGMQPADRPAEPGQRNSNRNGYQTR